METRANFILIGAFTLIAIVGTLGFFIWLAGVQIDRQYATYGVLFDDVSGLDASGDVLFNGIPVGKVIGLRIDENDPSKVFTTIEIDATTPVRSNTVAQLQSQGVTGVAYISLSGGNSGAEALTAEDGALPIIPSRRSTVQTLVEDAPDLLAEAAVLLEQFKALTGPANQAYVTNILQNLDQSSEQLDQALRDFSAITGTISEATAQITRFTDRLDGIGATVAATLAQTDETLVAAQETFASAQMALEGSVGAIDAARETFAQSTAILRDKVPDILETLSGTITRTGSAIDDLHLRSARLVDGANQTNKVLATRLRELESTLLDAATAFAAVTEAADSFDMLVDGDGTLLVVEARDVLGDAKASIAAIDRVVAQDVPVIVADIRRAVDVASKAVDTVANDLTDFTGQVAPLTEEAEKTLASASALFERSRSSLDGIDRALLSAEGTFAAAEAAFEATTNVMDTDFAPVLSDIRRMSERISATADSVSEDVPRITADLRALIARADGAVRQIQGAVASTAPGFGDFARTGLPELTRLGVEARGLVATLSSLARRLERDPARFLLNDRVPDYRR